MSAKRVHQKCWNTFLAGDCPKGALADPSPTTAAHNACDAFNPCSPPLFNFLLDTINGWKRKGMVELFWITFHHPKIDGGFVDNSTIHVLG